MKLFTCLLSLILGINVLAHDFQFSVFELTAGANDHIDLFVRLDKEDILKDLYDSCDNYSEVEQCLESYLNTHFALTFDGIESNFVLNELSHTKNFVEVKLSSARAISNINTIDIFNDVLVESKPQQENIVRFSFYDQQRSFRMNRERITTTITYKL